MQRDGFTLIPNEVLDDNTVSVPARFLYSVLLSFAWDINEAYPGQNRLAEALGVSDKSVRTYLSELEKKGYLTKKRRGLNFTNIYTLNKWIPTDYERKKLPIKKQKKSPLKKSSQLPSNNTQANKTQIDQTQSEGEITQHTSQNQGQEKFDLIMKICGQNLERVSHITLVDQNKIYGVLKKMAGYYSSNGVNLDDWTSRLIHWVQKDLEAGKFTTSEDVKLEVRYKKLRESISKTVTEVFGENWVKIDGLVEKVNQFLSGERGLETSPAELKTYLEYLKKSKTEKS